jgi:MscS family membrane protein
MFDELNAVLAVKFWGVEYRVILISLLTIVGSILFKTVITDLIFVGWRRLMIRQQKPWHDKMLDALSHPIASFILLLGVGIALDVLPLGGLWHHRINVVFKILATIVVFWGLISATNVGSQIVAEHGRRRGLSIATFMPLFRQIIIVVLVIIAIIIIVDKLGYSVSSIIAALGIGGAALAFASQSTLANIYGSIAIALDRPFKVGDSVKIGTIEGAVESIGLRSTQIRTDTNTLVSVPNNIIANEAVDNHTQRPNRRVKTTISLTYDATQKQIENIIADLQEMLSGMKDDLASEPKDVHLVALSDSSIDIELICFTATGSVREFYRIRQTILFNIMRIVEKNKASLAFPTQTVHVAKG